MAKGAKVSKKAAKKIIKGKKAMTKKVRKQSIMKPNTDMMAQQ